jgi:hypothetical protein
MTFGHADAAKGKAYDEAIINGVMTSPRVMRQMSVCGSPPACS